MHAEYPISLFPEFIHILVYEQQRTQNVQQNVNFSVRTQAQY